MLSPRKLCTKLNKIFAICLVPTQWQRQQQQQPTSCIVPACDDRRTRSIVRWHLKWLEKQLVGLGLESDWNSLWNGSIHDVSFLCTNPLIIFPLSKDYPTDFRSVIEWDAAPGLILNWNFQFFIFLRPFYSRVVRSVEIGWQILLIRLLSMYPTLLLLVLVTWEMVKEFSSTLMLRLLTRELPTATAQSTMTKQFRIFSKEASHPTGSQGPLFHLNVTNPMSKNTQCMALGYPLFYMILPE